MIKLTNWIENGITNANFQRIDQLTHPSSAQAVHFWNNRPADGIRMGRDVPSRNIASLLSNIIIFEPVQDGVDFKVHLAGELARQRFGRDITGERVTRLFASGGLTAHLHALNDVLSLSEPRMACITHKAGQMDLLKLELFQVPLVAPNGVDHWVLSFGFYF